MESGNTPKENSPYYQCIAIPASLPHRLLPPQHLRSRIILMLVIIQIQNRTSRHGQAPRDFHLHSLQPLEIVIAREITQRQRRIKKLPITQQLRPILANFCKLLPANLLRGGEE